jgi:hypothetical protein
MRRLPVLLVLLLAAAASGTNQQHSRAQRSQHLHKLFGALDSDRDGQLARQELSTAIGALGSSSSSQQAQQLTLEQSVEAAVGRLDSPDAGLGVSEAELEQHLQKLCVRRGEGAGGRDLTRHPYASGCCMQLAGCMHSRKLHCTPTPWCCSAACRHPTGCDGVCC